MKYLIPLIKLSRQHFEITPAKWGPKLRAFFYAVEENKIKSREDAANFLYGDLPTSSKYKSLESSARNKLFNNILTNEIKGNDHRKKTIYVCRMHVIVQILFLSGLPNLGGQVAEWLIHISRKYDITKVSLNLADMLVLYYLKYNINKHKADHYRDLSDKLFFAYGIERKIRSVYLRTYFPFHKKKSISDDLKKTLIEVTDHFAQYKSEVKTLAFIKHFSVLQIWRFEVLRNYKALINECKETLNDLDSFRFTPYSAKLLIYNGMLKCYIVTRRYDKAQEILELSSELKHLQGLNWFKNRLLASIVSLNTRQVEKGKYLIDYCLSSSRFKLFSDDVKEYTLLVSIYNELVQRKSVPLTQFETFSIFKRDKSGMGIPFRIAKIWNAALSDYTSIYDFKESTEKFISRNLNKGFTRTKIMFELIFLIPESVINFQNFEKLTELLLNELRNIAHEDSGEPDEIEIIHYELMWEYLIQTIIPQKVEKIQANKSKLNLV